jgi:uncharacterized protein YjbJ (UPF0337 family)
VTEATLIGGVPLDGQGYRDSMANEKMEDLKGRAKEAAGDLTDNDDLKREGKVDQASSKVKETVGDVADKVKDVVNKD